MSESTLDFLSKNCQQDKHQDCGFKWSGLGFEVVCRCLCHSSKKLEAIEVTPNPATNAMETVT